MKTFRDIYELPLKPTSHSWVYDNRSNFVFQFEPKFTKDGDYIKGWKDFEKNVIDKLNGDETLIFKETFTHLDGKIFYKDLHVITIRGWGNLTGIGAHNLPEEDAANIQDTFAEWMVETLNKVKQLSKYHCKNCQHDFDIPHTETDDVNDEQYEMCPLCKSEQIILNDNGI